MLRLGFQDRCLNRWLPSRDDSVRAEISAKVLVWRTRCGAQYASSVLDPIKYVGPAIKDLGARVKWAASMARAC